jgi:hypothetical protein
MKLIIERNKRESQGANVTIDTEGLIYPYAIREALELALELDGHGKKAIAEVFGQMPDALCESAPKYQEGDWVVVVVDGEERQGTIFSERVVDGIKVYDIQGKDFIGCYDEEKILLKYKFA